MSDPADLWAPLPRPTAFSATFWDRAGAGELALPKCDACGELHYPPRRHCPACGGEALTWTAMSGGATVVSHSTVMTSFHGQDWTGQLPYVVALVDLDEGPRMLTRLIGAETTARGDRVRVTFAEVQGRRLPYVTPEEPA